MINFKKPSAGQGGGRAGGLGRGSPGRLQGARAEAAQGLPVTAQEEEGARAQSLFLSPPSVCLFCGGRWPAILQAPGPACLKPRHSPVEEGKEGWIALNVLFYFFLISPHTHTQKCEPTQQSSGLRAALQGNVVASSKLPSTSIPAASRVPEAWGPGQAHWPRLPWVGAPSLRMHRSPKTVEPLPSTNI